MVLQGKRKSKRQDYETDIITSNHSQSCQVVKRVQGASNSSRTREGPSNMREEYNGKERGKGRNLQSHERD